MYGTNLTGTYENGTVFSITTAGVLKTLCSFDSSYYNPGAGSDPEGSLALDSQGNLYGVTFAGPGLNNPVPQVYKLAPGGAYTDLYDFKSTGPKIPAAVTATFTAQLPRVVSTITARSFP